MRTIIDIPIEQLQPLDALCAREEISRAEAIRQALAKWLAEKNAARKRVTIDDVFGLWADRADIGDALEHQRKLRGEWDDRERAVDEWSDYLSKKSDE